MAELMNEFKELFRDNIATMQNEWNNLRDELRMHSRNPDQDKLYPDRIEDIFIKTYPELVDLYLDYIEIQGNDGKNQPGLHESLKKLFNYSGEKDGVVPSCQPAIASFFMRHSKELGVSVCYYCETSFINTYGFSNIYTDFSEFLVSADKPSLMRHIRREDGKNYSDSVIDDIYGLCHEKDMATVVDVFDSYRYFKDMNPKKSERVTTNMHNHFDLDHFLPKSVCPLVGLSFYNLVPSCSVCNEKLKHTVRIGESDRARLLILSPTSCDYRFNEEIEVRIVYDSNVSTLRMQEHSDDFRLEFTPADNPYQEIVSVFRLDERYNFHKQIALKQHDLYQDFAPGHIKQLEKLLKGKTYKEIENQIFRNEYQEDSARCFDKLRNDIKKQCGR